MHSMASGKKRSCESETQLLHTFDDLAGGLDDKGQTDMILLDFSEAFDKVPIIVYYSKLHAVVLQALSMLGLKTLHDRTRKVVLKGQSSH